MAGETEHGFCSVCAKQGNITRTYFHYDIKCECHSPNHFEIVWHCPTCEPEEPKETQVRIRTENLEKVIDLTSKPCSQCNDCKFNSECRFKQENVNNSCKYYIKNEG